MCDKKDSGDDPDVTNGIYVYAKVSYAEVSYAEAYYDKGQNEQKKISV